jgi:hypothetical protein
MGLLKSVIELKTVVRNWGFVGNIFFHCCPGKILDQVFVLEIVQ